MLKTDDYGGYQTRYYISMSYQPLTRFQEETFS